VLARPFSQSQRRAVAAFWFTGAAIAGFTAPLAAVRDSAASGLVFAAVAAALIVLAVTTARALRSALAVSLVLLGLQLFGALGSAWELLHGVDEGKADRLRTLGFDPKLGVTVNLVYSMVAFTLFVWVLRQSGSASHRDGKRSDAER
jgi:hypothetical protein